MLAIREENGMTSDSVFLGQSLTIPLCRRYATPGPTPTATPPPPYPALEPFTARQRCTLLLPMSVVYPCNGLPLAHSETTKLMRSPLKISPLGKGLPWWSMLPIHASSCRHQCVLLTISLTSSAGLFLSCVRKDQTKVVIRSGFLPVPPAHPGISHGLVLPVLTTTQSISVTMSPALLSHRSPQKATGAVLEDCIR